MTTSATRQHQTIDDVALMGAVRRADQSALQAIYQRHGAAVYALACRVLRDGQQAEEIVQEVFLRLWNEPDRFDGGRGALRSFLFREVQSRSIERLRSEDARGRREARHEREAIPASYDLEQEAFALLRAERVKEAMLDLSEGEREAIYLAYFGGHSYRDVAVLLGLSEGTVKSRIRLGLQKLSASLHDLARHDDR